MHTAFSTPNAFPHSAALAAPFRRPAPRRAVQRPLALYDAPNFAPAKVESDLLGVDLGHAARMLGAVTLCVGGWAGAFFGMIVLWA